MISKIAFLYFSYFAWGCLALLPLVSLREIGQGFYRFFGFTCVALQTLALGIALMMGPALESNYRLAALALAVSLFFTLCFTVSLRVRVRWLLWTFFALAVLSGLTAIAYFPWAGQGALGFNAFHSVSSSLLLGAVTLAMMLGHWYLVIPKLSIAPLKRFSAAYILLTVLMALEMGLFFLLEGDTEKRDLFRREDIFVLFRVAWGMVVPLGLSYWIWITVSMKSTQSATGILYAAMVCTMMGEAMGLYLTLRTGIPF